MSQAGPSEVERTFLIADLSGYTALTESHGGVEAAKIVSRFVTLAEEALAPGASLFERVGDEILIVATAAAAGARTAVRLRDAVEREPLFPTVRTGVHVGAVHENGGRYFGAALNLTARLAGHARSGQILCTELIATAVAQDPQLHCDLVETVRLRNVAEPVRVFELSTPGTRREHAAIDPVCRMQVRSATAPARLPFRGATFYFCSFDCAKTFAWHPERYVDTGTR